MYEDFNGILLEVKPKGVDIGRGISATELAEVIAAFTLPPVVPYGHVFSNAGSLSVQHIYGWKDHIVGFISKDVICIMCFKAVEGRAAVGFHYDNEWLNRGLLQADGKTQVAPPKGSP